MEFLTHRTSAANGAQPCPQAYRRRFVRVDERMTDDPAKVPAHRGQREWWFREGRSHRVEKGRIRRDFDAEGWFVRIGGLEDLLALCGTCGDIIIRTSPLNAGVREIEIYDDLRE